MRAFSDWLLQVLLSDNLEAVFPNATGEYAPFIEEMWKDTAIQATYNRRNELQMLPRVATYFLDRVRLFSVFSLSLRHKTPNQCFLFVFFFNYLNPL